MEMTIRNHTEFLWHDVFAFNCLNPIQAPAFQGLEARTDLHELARPAALHGANDAGERTHAHGRLLSAGTDQGGRGVRLRARFRRDESRPHRRLVDRDAVGAGGGLHGGHGDGSRVPVRQPGPLLPPCRARFWRHRPGEASTTVSRLYLAKGTLDEFPPTAGSGPSGNWRRGRSARRGPRSDGRRER